MESKFKNKMGYVIFAVILMLGIILMTKSPENVEKNIDQSPSMIFSETEYEAQLESRLKSLIEEIDGVGEVSVMITLEGSARYSYAQDLNENIGADGDVKKETSVVLSAKSSSIKEAVVSGYTLPKIKGAAVVCENSLNAVLLEKVIGTVSASLGISTDKIYVTN